LEFFVHNLGGAGFAKNGIEDAQMKEEALEF